MLQHRLVSLCLSAIGTLLINAPTLEAQQSSSDSLAFARQSLAWLTLGEGDSIWAHSSERMRGEIQNPGAVEDIAAQLAALFGEETAVLGEQLLPRGDTLTYIRAVRHEQRPGEVVYWVVVFTPGDRTLQGIFPAQRATIEQQFPHVTLPDDRHQR